ncbi:MAG TPA: ATP-binding protein, partial [Rectinemataceae bacterium]|nr:ATP-binding protein [Rectinemataceae bacterium]
VGNAIKFTPAGRVELRVELKQREEGRARIGFAVHDTGIGIAPDQKERLYQPFTQADSSTTRRFGGTGLGLSICRELVNLMGGELEMASEPGKGSVFSFAIWLDLAEGVEEGPPHPGGQGCAVPVPKMPVPDFRGLRALIAEDSDINVEIATEFLRETGISVEVAHNGTDAVAKVLRSDPAFDIILMDIQMPGMDGYEAARLIRSDPRFAAVPIVAMTAHAFAEERRRSLQVGMNEHLAKPIDGELLLAAMARLLAPARPESIPPDGTMATKEVFIAAQDCALDFADGLARASGNERLYGELLRRFASQYEDAAAILEELALKEDADSAAKFAHKMRSVAGNLGLSELNRRAGELESALASGRPDGLSWAVKRFSAALPRTMSAIAEALARLEPEPHQGEAANGRPGSSLETGREDGAAPGMEPAHAREVSDLMRRYLEIGSSEAIALAARERRAFASILGPELLLRFDDSLAVLDYESALGYLDGQNSRWGHHEDNA